MRQSSFFTLTALPSCMNNKQKGEPASKPPSIHPSIHPLFLFHFFPSFPFPPSPSKPFLANSCLFSLFPPFNNSKCPARLAKLFSVNAVMPDECFFLNCAVLSAEELLLGLMMRAPSCLRLGLLREKRKEYVSFWGGEGFLGDGWGGDVYVFAAGALGFLSWP